jgi:hypothetical protein
MIRHLRRLQELCRRPWASYLLVLLLQLKMVWGIWEYRDLTPGDTSFYFVNAYRWFKDLKCDLAWSPLYTAFYGTFLHVSTDAYVATVLHRLAIICLVTLLFLALLRRFLPAEWALLICAWWAILPVNYNAIYEVHLFAVIPLLLCWLLLSRNPPLWARAAALGLLLAATFLMRNEWIIAFSLLAVVCFFWERGLRKRAAPGTAPRGRAYAAAYGLALLSALALTAWFHSRSIVQYEVLRQGSRVKHTFNMCQVYAFGYQERHPEWTRSPWTECFDLMASTFGNRLPSLVEMIRANPRAVLEHFSWNLRLAPSGLQVLLFNASWDGRSPDYLEYVPLSKRSPRALVFSVAWLAALAAGLAALWRRRHYWWEHRLRDRALAWLAMLCVAAVSLVVIPMQRPRPAYLFSLGMFLMAATGMGLVALAERLPRLQRAAAWAPLALIGLLLVAPNHYCEWGRIRPRILLENYRWLVPFQDVIADVRTVFLKGDWYLEVPNYVGLGASQGLPYEVLQYRPAGMPFAGWLDQRGINLLFVDASLEQMLRADGTAQAFLRSPESARWKVIGRQEHGRNRWTLLQKTLAIYEDARELKLLNDAAADIGPADARDALRGSAVPTDGLFVGEGWYEPETYDGETFRWVDNDAEIVVTAPTGARRTLLVDVEPGPALPSRRTELQIRDVEGAVVARTVIGNRMEVVVDLPISPARPTLFRLHATGEAVILPSDARMLRFRVFRFAWKG